jgi:hypothetical protein
MFQLTGQTALITGASGGIGGAIARAFHAQGATIALSGTREEALQALATELKATGSNPVHVIPCNLSDSIAVEALFPKAEELMGKVDILVNNAGIGETGPIIDQPFENFKATFDVNVFGTFKITQKVLRNMMTKNKKGKEVISYQNSWITDLEVTDKNIETLVRGGRCKWKIENECFNTLKNQGYCIDHSYGHGENLSFNFYLLTLLAFAFHQVFELTDKLYQTCRLHFGSKKNLWEHVRSYLKLFVFETWEALLSFSLNPEHYLPDKMPERL